MKRILITGANSYIGGSFKKLLNEHPKEYSVDELDMIDGSWKNYSFKNYDTILHVAGIAHVSANPKMKEVYFKINRDLAIETAKKAKNEKVKQFIFMSSMIIYGDDAKIGKYKIINKNTIPSPANFYGQSKLDADLAIQQMSDDTFKTVIIRTPMVYGPNCKGNFPRLVKFALKMPVFPKIDNKRSMIYIDNLCEIFKLIIDNEENGIFYPQNEDYISTNNIIKTVREIKGKKTIFCSLMNPFVKFASLFFSVFNKIYGSKIYDIEDKYTGNKKSFKDSIKSYLDDM